MTTAWSSSESASTKALSRSSAASSLVGFFSLSISLRARRCPTLDVRVVKIVTPKRLSGKYRSKPSLPVDGSRSSISSALSTISSHLPAVGALRCRLTSSFTSSPWFVADCIPSCCAISSIARTNASTLSAGIQKTDISGCCSATEYAKLSTNCVLPMPPSPTTANLWQSCALTRRRSRTSSSARRPTNW